MAAPVSTQRVLIGVAATLTAQLRDQDGSPTAAVGAVTVDVTAADGTPLAVGAATTTDGATPPAYQYALAAYPKLDLLTLVWKDGGVARVTTTVDVVGGYYFSVAQARAFDQRITTAIASDAKIITVRREIEDECERITRKAWVPRYRRLTLNLNSGDSVLAACYKADVRPVRTITGSDGTVYGNNPAASAGQWAGWFGSYGGYGAAGYGGPDYGGASAVYPPNGGTIIDGNLYGGTAGWSSSTQSFDVAVEYGENRPPADLLHATLTRLRQRLWAEKVPINNNNPPTSPTLPDEVLEVYKQYEDLTRPTVTTIPIA